MILSILTGGSGSRACRSLLRQTTSCHPLLHPTTSTGSSKATAATTLTMPRFLSSNSSTSSSGSSTAVAFDRDLKIQQRNNAARAHQVWKEDPDAVAYDYFRDEIARRLVDRLDDIKREEGFPLALDIGAGCGHVHRAICADAAIDGMGGIGGVRKLVQLESAHDMLHRDDEDEFEGMDLCDTYRMQANEEDTLPFPDGTFDLVISSCALHWINNLPGLFREAHVCTVLCFYFEYCVLSLFCIYLFFAPVFYNLQRCNNYIQTNNQQYYTEFYNSEY